ncbi:MAG: hypothetical protein JNL39_17815 [Opitutaceae bacterium]|nr:hypothetical protein [Opitutaceae bacterium]
MNTRSLPRFLALVAMVFAALASPAFANEKGESVGTLIVPDGLSTDEIKEAIALSFAGRGWTIKERTNSKVVGHINQRGNEAFLYCSFNKKEIQLRCEGWEVSKTGERKKPEIPKGWVDNIKKDVTKRMNMKAATK